MEGKRFDALARRIGATSNRRDALRLVAAGAGALVAMRLGGRDAAAACVQTGLSCKADSDCCSMQCDGPKGRAKTCRGGGNDSCRHAGAPCDPNAPKGAMAACCGAGVCQSTAGSNFKGGLPPYTCSMPPGGCPDGRDPCPGRQYSGMGPQQCCAPGDTCSGNHEYGCVASTCSYDNESNQDIWGAATCGGSPWCLCMIAPEGGYACADVSGTNVCANRTNCQSHSDCPSGQVCAMLMPGWCGNNSQTIRICRPSCGNGGGGGGGGKPTPTCAKIGAACGAPSDCCTKRCLNGACRKRGSGGGKKGSHPKRHRQPKSSAQAAVGADGGKAHGQQGPDKEG